MKLSAPIFRLKRRAKSMARDRKISMTEALNRVAEAEGFGAWSLLAAQYARRDPAPDIAARLQPGDVVLIAARPMQGKTMLALRVLSEAAKMGRPCAFFTLEHTTAEAVQILAQYDIGPETVLLDTSDAICADYVIEKLTNAKRGTVVIIDYLQALDHERENSPVGEQVLALRSFAIRAGATFLFISQIDRRYDPSSKPFPDILDVRMPNKIDSSLFNRTFFLREGEVICGEAGIAA